MKTLAALAVAGVLGTLAVGSAVAQSGPVARSCGADIGKLCAERPHDGSVRVCLEQAYDQLSASCKKALDTTGGGRGKQLGKGKGGPGQGKGPGQGQGKGKAS